MADRTIKQVLQQCKILVIDYSNPSYQDASDQYFEIGK